MNDSYGSSGFDETDHWILFGDPSISLRTNSPSNLSISHSGSIDPADGAYEITVSGNHDNVLAALSYNGLLLGSAYDDNGIIIITTENDLSNYNDITLTVTGYNTTTVIESITVGETCPSYILGDLNGDSIINIIDVVSLTNIVLGLVTPTYCQLEVGDLNGDGAHNIIDIILVVNVILLIP